jgi:PHD/YefM family antitoxin component YafN of YafNO toxin-antitoxin module
MAPRITSEQREALDREQGKPICLEDEGGTYVLMSADAFRAMMGVESESDMAQSVAAIRAGLDDVAAGRSRPLTEALNDLATRHGLSR